MSVRRVQIEDDHSAYVDSDAIDLIPADFQMSADEARFWAEHEQIEICEAEESEREEEERASMIEVPTDDGDILLEEAREMDLAPRDAVPSPRREPVKWTAEQARLEADWGDVRPSDEGTTELERARDYVGVERDSAFREIGPEWREDLSQDDAARWLREAEITATPDQVRGLLRAAGIEDAGPAFKSGRPTAERIELRSRIRVALTAMHEDGRRRDLMAHALGCSRQALHALMTAKP